MTRVKTETAEKSWKKHKRCFTDKCYYFMRRLYVRLSRKIETSSFSPQEIKKGLDYERWWQAVGWVCRKHHIVFDEDAQFNFSGRVSKRTLYIELSGDFEYKEEDLEAGVLYPERQYKRSWENVGMVYSDLTANIDENAPIGDVDFGQWSPRR